MSRYGRWPSIYCPRVSSRGRLKPPRPKPGGVTTRRMDVVYSNTTIRYVTEPAMRSNAHIPQIPTSHPHHPQPQPQPSHGHRRHQPTLACLLRVFPLHSTRRPVPPPPGQRAGVRAKGRRNGSKSRPKAGEHGQPTLAPRSVSSPSTPPSALCCQGGELE